MASYFEAYGEAEQRAAKRNRVLQIAAGCIAGSLILFFVLRAVFENYGEERQVKLFVADLKKGDFKAAYSLWGCTDAAPCKNYAFEKFMDDWGPDSPYAKLNGPEAGSGDSCGTGVVVAIEAKAAEPIPLWVDRATKVIGYSPDPECRKRRWRFRAFFRKMMGKPAEE